MKALFVEHTALRSHEGVIDKNPQNDGGNMVSKSVRPVNACQPDFDGPGRVYERGPALPRTLRRSAHAVLYSTSSARLKLRVARLVVIEFSSAMARMIVLNGSLRLEKAVPLVAENSRRQIAAEHLKRRRLMA